jgi:hypothetical protein
MKKIFASILLVFLIGFTVAEIKKPVKWKVSLSPNAQVGKTATLKFEATIDDGWHLYASDFDPDLGPTVTEVVLADGSKHSLKGKLISEKSTHQFDKTWGGEVSFFSKKGVFTQQIDIKSKVIEGSIKGQACIESQCVQTKGKFKIDISNPKAYVIEIK